MDNLAKGLYFYKVKDITMSAVIQIRDVIHVIMEKEGISFIEAANKFHLSKTYEVLTDVENTLWAEPPRYIAEMFFEEGM